MVALRYTDRSGYARKRPRTFDDHSDSHVSYTLNLLALPSPATFVVYQTTQCCLPKENNLGDTMRMKPTSAHENVRIYYPVIVVLKACVCIPFAYWAFINFKYFMTMH